MIDLPKLFEELSVPYWTSGKNVTHGWCNISCPMCNDHSNHCGINQKSGNFNCWACSSKGSIYDLIMELEHCDLLDAKRLVRKYKDGDDLPAEKKEKVVREFHNIIPAGMTRDLSEDCKEYLRSRRYDAELVAEKYEMYSSKLFVGEYIARILIPIIYKKQIVNFVARSILPDAKKKVKNCPNDKCIIEAKDMLFNLDNVRDRKLIVVEGIFDAMRIGDGAVATLGTQVIDTQINLIREYADEVYIMFDSKKKDPNAPALAEKLGNRLYGLVKKVEVIYLDDGDPDDMTEKEVQQLRKEIGI